MTALLPIEGTRVDGRSLQNFIWNADLIAFDGPLLSLFKSDDGGDFLFSWLDCDERRHLWCIIPIGRENLRGYLTKQISLLQVLRESKAIVTFYSNVSARRSCFLRTTWNKLPVAYLPSEDSYLSDELSTDAAKRLGIDLPCDYSIALDGELYLEDLESIPKLYQQLYSFHYGLEHLSRYAVRDVIARHMRRFRGGFSVVNLFTGLRSVTPSIHRARLVELKYNSPGHIKLNMLPSMAESIAASTESILGIEEFEKTEALYKSVYKFFRDAKLSGFDDERAETEVILTRLQLEYVQRFIDDFFRLMRWSNYQAKFVSLEISPLSQLRVLLAYYRRLRRLRTYIAQEKVKLQ